MYDSWGDVPVEGWGVTTGKLKRFRQDHMEWEWVPIDVPYGHSPAEQIEWLKACQEAIDQDPDNREYVDDYVDYGETHLHGVWQWPSLNKTLRKFLDKRQEVYKEAKSYGLEVQEPPYPKFSPNAPHNKIVWRRSPLVDITAESLATCPPDIYGVPYALANARPWLIADEMLRKDIDECSS